MDLSDAQKYEALRSGDSRFDGVFYICVLSTGIYCRPICPAKTSKFKNCKFVKSAAEAEEQGFRACLRCRPESAPGSPAWLGTSASVNRALRLISENNSNNQSIALLAEKLGMSERHLRRLFIKHIGASPQAVIQASRFATARQLLRETNLKITEVAFASGFKSLRRFNDAIKKAYDISPSNFRKDIKISDSSKNLPSIEGQVKMRLRLGYRPPYQWDKLISYFKMRAIDGVEYIKDNCYIRTVSLGTSVGVICVHQDIKKNQIVADFSFDEMVLAPNIIQRLSDMFDLEMRPDIVTETLAKSPALAPKVKKSAGLRIPGTWDLYELCVRTIVGQQISVKGAITILGRLVDRLGREVSVGNGSASQLYRVFPRPDDLVNGDLNNLGLTKSRIRTLLNISRAFQADANFINTSLEYDEAYEKLISVAGIGPWTAQYIGLRGLRNPDAFPASDLVLLKATEASSPVELLKAAQVWRPWRGYAAIHLWNGEPTNG